MPKALNILPCNLPYFVTYLWQKITLMEEAQLEKLRYPVGKFSAPLEYSRGDMDKWISEIENLPSLLKSVLGEFTEEMLNEPYRPGGWSPRQVVHHIGDSHMNAYIRFKLALTEDNPTIRPYLQDRWAELNDSKMAPPDISLDLLYALHRRWVWVIKNMKDSDFDRTYLHPEGNKIYKLRTVLALYAWHCRHHLEHIKIVKEKFTGVKTIR